MKWQLKWNDFYLLQNQTRTTSFSIDRPSANMAISSDVGLGLARKAFSKATRTLVSIDVRFFLRRPNPSLTLFPPPPPPSGDDNGTPPTFPDPALPSPADPPRHPPLPPPPLPPPPRALSASSSHFCSSGFSLHMFLNDRLSASNRDMVVWLKSLPYSFPMAKPTSPWVKPVKEFIKSTARSQKKEAAHLPSLIRRCLNVLANCSNSSRSVVSSGGRS